MNAMELLTGPVAQAVGWALLHLLWQATIVAGIMAAVLALMSRQTASARYIVSCGALAVVFAMFIATAVRAYDPAAAPIAPSSGSAPETIQVSLKQLPVLLAETAAVSVRERAIAALSSARTSLPTIVGIWLAGVILLSSRLLVSWVRARNLVRHGSQPATPEWQRIASNLSNALGLRRAVTLLESAAVEVPSVIGSLRPIILLPASALTGLTPEQIEMVLAHELAHIRRHDFLVNLLQAVVETLMFFHPAVWWMSRRVRIERENCCDDLAVAVCGNPLQYARALTRLEELRASALPVVVAANGGSLLDRIRRIAAGRSENTSSTSRWAAAVAMLSILIIAVAVPTLPALAQREEKKKATAAAAPQPVNSTVDVVVDAQNDIVIDDEDLELDVDSDFDVELPEPPEPPEPPDMDFDEDMPMAPVAPMPPTPPMPMVAPAPDVPPAPPAPEPPFAIGAAPRPPRPPHARIAMLDRLRHDDDDEDDDEDVDDSRPVARDGKLTVDELISLRAVGVTPAYLDAMRAIFPNLTVNQATGMRAVGVSPEYIREMRDAGFEVKTPNAATSLRAVGVTADYVRQMRDAGFTITKASDATGLRAVGVTPDYVREMRNAGFTITRASDATGLRAVGVTPEYVTEMRAAGFTITKASDVTGMRAVGVTAEWLRAMKTAGVDIRTASEATGLRALGVTPEFVKKLANSGYSNLTIRELKRLAASGVDDDFIREMEQYRKKN